MSRFKCVDWFHLAQDRVQDRALVNTVMNRLTQLLSQEGFLLRSV